MAGLLKSIDIQLKFLSSLLTYVYDKSSVLNLQTVLAHGRM